MAGLRRAVERGYVEPGETGILDSTAHMLKFLAFQEMYFQDSFGPEFHVRPREELRNAPRLVRAGSLKKFPEHGKPLEGEDMKRFVEETAAEIARILGLQKK